MIGLPPSGTLAIALVALVATGCARPTATATPGPTAAATMTRAPTATSTASRSPTPTPSVTPSPPDQPHPVVMTLEDARREVLSWAIPANEASVERALYVTAAEIGATFPQEQQLWGLFDGHGYLGPGASLISDEGTVFDPIDESKTALQPEHVLIVIDASQQGIDLMHANQGADERPHLCESVSSRSRARFLSVFDATRGRYIGSYFVTEPWQSAWIDALARSQPIEVALMASPTSTPTVTATATPRESRTPDPNPSRTPIPTAGLPSDATAPDALDAGQVPAPLVDAAREMAEVPGSRWVYRVTELWEGIHWSQHIVTETIEASWRIAPDVMMNQRAYEPSSVTDQSFYSPWVSTCYDSSRRYVFPNGVTGTDRDERLSDMRRLLTVPPTPVASTNCPPSGIVQILRLPLQPNEVYNEGWRTTERASIEVPAGTFRDCYALQGAINMMNGATHWICPGVGVVRHEVPDCHTFGGGFELYELIDYDIPPIVPVP